MKNQNIMQYVRHMAESYLERGILRFTINMAEIAIEWVAPRQYAIMVTPRNGGNPFNAGYIFA